LGYETPVLAGLATTSIRPHYRLFTLNWLSINSKKTLLNHIAKELNFPDYFGQNWDALEECLRDLPEWSPARGYVLIFEDAHIFRQSAPDDFLVFLEIIVGIAEEFADKKVPLFLILSGAVPLQAFNYGDLKDKICIRNCSGGASA
jgi:RNAse (barnase) inhibitor barstar